MPSPAATADAMARLRAALGVDVVFIVPGAITYAPGTPIDPESQRPFDPFLAPESAAAATEITVRASLVHAPTAAADPARTPLGNLDRGSAVVIVAAADYPGVAAATRAQIADELWDIGLWRQDVALGVTRWLAYLEHA